MKRFQVNKLTVCVYQTRNEMGAGAAKEAAEHLRLLLAQQEEVNAIFAAAPSQNEFLAALLAAPGIDWSRVRAFHMDEYIGLSADAPQGFGNFLKDRFFGLAPLREVHYLNGCTVSAQAECNRYGALLRQYPPDVVFMGIGENGHIAFNDPPVADFQDKELVKVVQLEERCRQQQVNDGCFAALADVPEYALTLTIPALLASKRIFCMVPGKTKAEAVKNTLYGAVSAACPASILQTRAQATLYLDCDSARELPQEP